MASAAPLDMPSRPSRTTGAVFRGARKLRARTEYEEALQDVKDDTE